ncbi:MAG: mannuronan 5-epimerase [Actinoplanes sp.]|nr:mannuronan 5-epimerase [Actinoplanes sp.]
MRTPAIAVVIGLVLASSPLPAPAAVPAYEKGAFVQEPAGPRRQPRRLLPSQFAAANKPHLLVHSRRQQMVLRPDGRLDMMTGARIEWIGNLARAGLPPRAIATLPVLARLVSRSPHPDWLTELRPGVFILRKALVQAAGTRLVIAAPQVTQLRMVSTGKVGEEVYLTGVSAKVAFNGTTVTSWRLNGTPDPLPSLQRPFISYDQPGSVLTAAGSHFSYLGGDSILAYGVTWGRQSTGSATDTTFDHNFFGAYSNAAVSVLLQGDIFRDNDLYGLDPHSGSRRLVIRDNMSFDNGSHGIILSRDVVDSVITGNRTFGNRYNGIMMDAHSDRNLISGNQSWNNDGDGIVVQNSDHVTVRGNLVNGNRVGVRVNGDSLYALVTHNELVGNSRGIEFYAGPAPARALTRPALVDSNNIVGNGTGDGIAVKNFAGTRIVGNQVSHHVNGVLLAGSSNRARIVGNHLTGQIRGIEVNPEVIGARLGGNVITAATERGLVLAGRGIVSAGDQITGSDIGVDVRRDVTLSDVTIRDGRRGINVVTGTATVAGATINVQEYGVNVATTAALRLQRSTIVAGHPVVGTIGTRRSAAIGHSKLQNPPPPFQWLALAGALFILTAVGLHMVGRRRAPTGRPGQSGLPNGVRNAW